MARTVGHTGYSFFETKNKWDSVILLVFAHKDVELPPTANDFVKKMAKNSDPKAFERV